MSDMLLLIMIIVCLYTDLKERKIYNAMLLPGFILGILLNLISNGWGGLLTAVQGFLLGLGLLLLPFLLNGIGAGDVKLLAVIGVIKGPEFVFYTFLGTALAGGLIALGILLFQGRLGKVLCNLGRGLVILLTSRFRVVSFGDSSEQNLFPYGIAIAVGVLTSYLIEVI
ncbi:MAG: prepilin peptidase [Dehalobacterium sp.]